MSLHLEFEPHSWYMEFAIKKENTNNPPFIENAVTLPDFYQWSAVTANGDTYRIDDIYAYTLSDLHQLIREYHLRQRNGYGERIAKRRLEYLRGELRAERISYGELAELQSLAHYIDKSDVELLEPAGVPER